MIPSRVVEDAVILDVPNIIESDKLSAQAHDLLFSNRKKIALNLSNLTFIESSGLGALVKVHKMCEDEGGKLVLYALQPYVLKLVEVTRLDRVLKIELDESAALTLLKA